MARNVLIQIRRDTASNWASVNPILAQGEIGWAYDTNVMKIGNGSSTWTALTTNNIITNATSAGGDLTGTYPAPTLVTSGVTASTYGSASAVPVVAVDAKGRITSASNSTIAITNSQVSGLGTASTKDIPATGNASTTQVVYGSDTRLTDSRTPSGSASGDLTGSYPGPTLTTTGVTNGTYGSATSVPTIAVDTKGRITSASNTTIAIPASAVTGTAITQSTSAGGDLTGTYPNPTLATSGVTAGSYTNTNLTVDAKGRITSASNGSGGGVVPNYRVFPTGSYFTVKSTTSNFTGSSVTMTAIPFWLSTTTTFTKIGAYVTSSGSASSFRLGIWNNDATTDKPNTLLADYGTVATTSTGFKEVTGQTITLSAGLWWLGGVNTGSPGASMSGTTIGFPLYPIPNASAPASNSSYNAYTGTYSSGTLPTFGTATPATQGFMIWLGL